MVGSGRGEKISVSSEKQRFENGARNLPMRICSIRLTDDGRGGGGEVEECVGTDSESVDV